MANAPAHSYVLRDTFTSVVYWFAVAVGVVLVGEPLVRGALPLVATTAPIVALVLWALWMVLFHPHVRYDDQRAVVTNIGRVYELPWSRVAAVRQHLSLTFELDDGRRIGATGVTAPRDRGLVLAGLSRGKLGVSSGNYHHNADALRSVQETAPPSPDPVVSRWDRVPLTIGAVLVVAAAIDAAVLLSR